MKTLIENYINGNITIARKQTKRFSGFSIQEALIEEYGYSERKDRLTAYHLKTGEGWQAACDAD